MPPRFGAPRQPRDLDCHRGAAGFIAYVTATNISRNLTNATPTLGIPFWIFLGATFFGFAGAALVHLLHLRNPPQADTNIALTEMGFAVVIAFLSLFLVGFPVVYAILLPSIAYVLIEGLPLGTAGAAHHLCARLLPAGRGAAVHLRRQPDEPGGHHRPHLPLRLHAGRPHSRRPGAGQHLRQPHLLRHVRRGARRYRRARPDRDRGHEEARLRPAPSPARSRAPRRWSGRSSRRASR